MFHFESLVLPYHKVASFFILGNSLAFDTFLTWYCIICGFVSGKKFVHLVFVEFFISVESIDFQLLLVVSSFDFFKLADEKLFVVD